MILQRSKAVNSKSLSSLERVTEIARFAIENKISVGSISEFVIQSGSISTRALLDTTQPSMTTAFH